MGSSSILSPSGGKLVVEGAARLSRAEEQAINLLLRRAGGEEDGMQLYKLGWALEDNYCHFNPSTNEYVYDFENRTPICFHPQQASYHLLVWEPPSAQHETLVASGELKGDDARKGSYNCVNHFIDPKTEEPLSPQEVRVQLIEITIPTMKQMTELAQAARKGFLATQYRLRKERIARIQADETKKQQQYNSYAETLLEDSAPAFEGNPTSFPTKGKSFSDLMPGERAEKQSQVEQPTEFAVSVRSRVKS